MASSGGNRLALANRLPVAASNHKLDDDSTPIRHWWRAILVRLASSGFVTAFGEAPLPHDLKMKFQQRSHG
jgi:hypothetical protein